MNTIDSLGLLEVRGLVAGIEAADAMLKSARVRLLRQLQVDPGLITLVVEGDLAACRASVDAGIAAARRVGEVVSQRVIGAPDGDTDDFVLTYAERGRTPFGERSGAVNNESKASAVTKTVKAEAGVAGVTAMIKTVEASAAGGKNPPDRGAMPGVETALLAVLDFIAHSGKGHTWREIANRFPGLSPEVQAGLDAVVKDGRLSKVGGRYRHVGSAHARPGSRKKDRSK